MANYLFLFTIGPVQSFIAQARKTQDLYAGSQLLSDLITFAIDKLNLPKEENLIFPNKNLDSKPNRFIAIIENKTEDEIKKLGEDIKNAVNEELLRIANKSKKGNPPNFEKQIKDFLQIYWVALPLSDYKKDYAEIERYLGAVKNVRVFSQLEETGRKCSLCGERNVLFYKLTDSEEKKGGLELRNDGLLKKLYVKDVVYFNPKKEEYKFKMEKGEGLCAVCFTKRFYPTSSFPSTAEIALMDVIPKEEFDKFKYDAQLFYDENLTEKYFEKHGIRESVKTVKRQVNNILEKFNLKSSSLPKYYAIIAFDGDNMGKWLSGDSALLKENIDLEKFHKELSKRLGEFAKNAKGELIEPKGKAVYAGGDDFIGFVNLNHLFDVMQKLRDKFDEQVNKPLKENEEFGIKSDLTFSAGVAIAHYKIPLSEVLNWARKMEKEAKEIDDGKEAKEIDNVKDAFAIAVLKHSGEINKTVYKWKYANEWTTDLMDDIVKKLITNKFSNTFIKNLNIEFARLTDAEGKLTVKTDILSTELKRLLRRSCNEPKKGRTQKKYDEETGITSLVDKLEKIYKKKKEKEYSFDNFVSLLNIADFIARHINEKKDENKNDSSSNS